MQKQVVRDYHYFEERITTFSIGIESFPFYILVVSRDLDKDEGWMDWFKFQVSSSPSPNFAMVVHRRIRCGGREEDMDQNRTGCRK